MYERTVRRIKEKLYFQKKTPGTKKKLGQTLASNERFREESIKLGRMRCVGPYAGYSPNESHPERGSSN